jgi:hypothetical protein
MLLISSLYSITFICLLQVISLTQFTTCITKKLAGRLRPDFYEFYDSYFDKLVCNESPRDANEARQVPPNTHTYQVVLLDGKV